MSKTLIQDVAGWSFYSCPCVAEWWPLVQTMALRRGLVKQKLDVSQGGYNRGGVSASAGTHDEGGVLDLRQYSDGVVKLLREAGSAAWHRGYPEFPNNEHTHLVLIGCPHLQGRPSGNRRYPIGAAKQVESYKAGRDGLAMNGPDNGPQVRVRTWREGVAWMRSQLTPAADGPATAPTSPTPGTPTPAPNPKEFPDMDATEFKKLFKAAFKESLRDPEIAGDVARAALGGTYGIDASGDGKPDTAGNLIASIYTKVAAINSNIAPKEAAK